MTFGVLGGDRRQAELARWLRERGHETRLWGLERAPESGCVSLEAAAEADCLVLPLPVSRDGERLFAPLSGAELPLAELWPRLRRGQLLCGGMATPEMRAAAAERGARLEDYFCRESLQVRNAAVTAEGALLRAMEEGGFTLWGTACLVLGFGRIGKLLALRLRGLGARVAVAARRAADLAWIEAVDCAPVDMGDLEAHLGRCRVLFNTVPVPLLGRERLALLRRDCLVVDLASAPGGVDRPAAEELGLRVLWERSLPGRTAPETAAAAMGRTICEIVEEGKL